MKKLFIAILIAALSFCMDAYAQRPDYSDETEQMLMRYRSGRLNFGGCNLSDLELQSRLEELSLNLMALPGMILRLTTAVWLLMLWEWLCLAAVLHTCSSAAAG